MHTYVSCHHAFCNCTGLFSSLPFSVHPMGAVKSGAWVVSRQVEGVVRTCANQPNDVGGRVSGWWLSIMEMCVWVAKIKRWLPSLRPWFLACLLHLSIPSSVHQGQRSIMSAITSWRLCKLQRFSTQKWCKSSARCDGIGVFGEINHPIGSCESGCALVRNLVPQTGSNIQLIMNFWFLLQHIIVQNIYSDIPISLTLF